MINMLNNMYSLLYIGARQLDTVPATIEVIADICRAVGSKVKVASYP